MRKSTRNAATRKYLTIRCRLSAMFMFYSTSWAPRTSQLMSDQHSRSQMIVPIPKLHRMPAQGIACWSRRPGSAPDSNQQTPLRKCTSCASPSKQLPAHNVKKPTCDLYRQAIPFGCGIRQRARTSRSLRHVAIKQIKTSSPTGEWNFC